MDYGNLLRVVRWLSSALLEAGHARLERDKLKSVAGVRRPPRNMTHPSPVGVVNIGGTGEARPSKGRYGTLASARRTISYAEIAAVIASK